MLQPIILAAGKGTRMGSELPKTLCIVAGKPMIAHILASLGAAGNCLPPIVVVGHKGAQVKDFLGASIATVEQTDLSGTGTAAKIALSTVAPEVDKVLIMYGDHPFITPESIKKIEETHDATGATITLGTTTVPDYNDWRRVFVSFGRVILNLKGDVM
jgi:bifunctional UDP-N-acetylglucosamine pyrophosphorylase/glucosamine-1-phosphate N-acetyltransferase